MYGVVGTLGLLPAVGARELAQNGSRAGVVWQAGEGARFWRSVSSAFVCWWGKGRRGELPVRARGSRCCVLVCVVARVCGFCVQRLLLGIEGVEEEGVVVASVCMHCGVGGGVGVAV